MSEESALPWPHWARLKKTARQIIVKSDLPDPIKLLIARIIHKAKLWKREQSAVAEELVAHFRDGLEAGRSAQDLIDKFGDPLLTAKLIRRAKRRNRPIWWRTSRRFIQTVTLFVAAWVTAALLLAIRQPRVTVDYVAKFNQTLPTAPPNQQAWPIYRAALLNDSLDHLRNDLYNVERDKDGHAVETPTWLLRPRNANWWKAAAVLKKHRVLLEAAREGGLKLVYGLPALPAHGYSAQDRQALGLATSPARLWSDSPAFRNSLRGVPWYEIQCPVLVLADLLRLDSWSAADRGDATRVIEDYRAAIGMVRQCSETVRPFSYQYVTGTCQDVDRTLADVNLTYPHLLDGRRVQILHIMTGVSPLLNIPNLANEDMRLLDLIQRMYSDNGHGDGHITFAGILRFNNDIVNSPGPKPGAGQRLAVWGGSLGVLPIAVTIGMSRKQVIGAFDSSRDAAVRQAHQPLRSLFRTQDAIISTFSTHETSEFRVWFQTFRNPLADCFNWTWPLLNVAIRCDYARAVHDATMTALALDVWRHDHNGAYPATLDELVPRYLPRVPIDLSTGQPLHYKVKGGQPLLYGLGLDGVDNGGVTRGPIHWPDTPAQGDWVLYPPVRETAF